MQENEEIYDDEFVQEYVIDQYDKETTRFYHILKVNKLENSKQIFT